MKLLMCGLMVISGIIFLTQPALAFPEDNLSSLLSGKILLDANNKEAAWYVYPGDFHRYYLGAPTDAYDIMRNLSLGVSNDNFSKIVSSTPDRLKGLLLLKPEDEAKVYYVNPENKNLVYLAGATSSYNLLRQLSVTVSNQDLETIPIGKIILDASGWEVARTWQYRGWWGAINSDDVPVRARPKNDSARLGTFSRVNKIKILAIRKEGGHIWYQIDGGRYPGAYIDSLFVNAIAQPTADKNLVIPAKVGVGDYWLDVNISKKILTLYQYDKIILLTYIAVGSEKTPTLTGVYNVWLKFKKTRMKGGPPISPHVYNLPNVPWVMYYKGSYSVHGTYWHDNFGTQISAGCTGVTQGDAKFIFELTGPVIGTVNSIYSTKDNPGVLVNNHL